jgi:hypothetical protein
MSRAIVDRVIHKRPGVHPRTKGQVELAMARMDAEVGSKPPLASIDVALRLDRGMMDEMFVAAQ